MTRAAAVAALAFPASAWAAPETLARIVVAETELRSGPGVSHRVISRAFRGDTFLVEGRETKGFWLEVSLPDGRTTYLLGDTVELVRAEEDALDGASKRSLFAPPALKEARGGFAMLAGIYDQSGYAEVRPALVIAPAIALEPYVGIALEPDSRHILYGAAGTLNLAPDWAIAPFFLLGVGGLLEEPKEEFLRERKKWFHARAGGGFLVSFKFRMLVRLEASNLVLFTEDDYQNTQAYIAGLGTYF